MKKSGKILPASPEVRDTSFRGDVIRLVLGSGFTQIFTLVSIPVLTRLYSPDAFGVAAVFTSIVTIFGVLACMRYEQSIVIPENDSEAANMLVASISIACVMAIMTAVAVWIGADYLTYWLDVPQLTNYIWLVPVAVFLQGVFNALGYWNIRIKDFGRLSAARAAVGVTSTSSQLALGAAGYTTSGAMIHSQVFGQFAATCLICYQVLKKNGAYIIHCLSFKEICEGLRRYHKFPLYGSFSIFLGVAAWQLPVLMMGYYFSTAVVGFYALGFRVLQSPVNLIGSAIGQVFFKSAAEAKIQGRLDAMVVTIFGNLVRISLFPMLMLAIVSVDLYRVVFGDRWMEAGMYTQILTGWAWLWFLTTPFTPIFSIYEKQELQLKWNVLNFCSRLLVIVIAGILQSPLVMVILLSLAGVLVYGYKVVLMFRLADAELAAVLKIFVNSFLLFLPAGGCVVTLMYADVGDLIVLGFALGFLMMHAVYIVRKKIHVMKLS
ncbi:oligosaccharide flippase family protein [Sedimenticola thiotaurini]|uniref:Oligosaccharide flippase family protein n=1 Tax=Sedimenticola thiotaurini TaxID=1543721 RepID=A0A0F7K1L7_9GAMM|nr:oligosaccharide flippase family protein [Sedimenticola thiotaurini]AKH20848.1 hypothetical protein AAY24_11365 [Sedimenticola thiotaurini]